MSIKQAYKQAYSAIRRRENLIGQTGFTRFDLYHAFHEDTKNIPVIAVVRADMSYMNRDKEFNGHVMFDFRCDLEDYMQYHEPLDYGYAMRFYSLYEHAYINRHNR